MWERACESTTGIIDAAGTLASRAESRRYSIRRPQDGAAWPLRTHGRPCARRRCHAPQPYQFAKPVVWRSCVPIESRDILKTRE
jgi:hypothetical protein